MPNDPRLPPAGPTDPIAVVGMAGRFPGAPDLDSFWELLQGGGDAIRPVPPERWDTSVALDPEKQVQGVGGFLEGVDQFDPTFFGISPREAEDVDPQQRLMLEMAWLALEDAGQRASALRGARAGVYVGSSWHDYELLRTSRGAPTTQHSTVGNALDVIAARVSYFLKLRGPSLTVETGCSSSLVALHLACQALRLGEVDAAIVGGVNLILAPAVSIGLTHFGGLSPQGRCKAFSASADGFVRGEGAVALYLKPLSRALADGDRVRGILVHTAVNNDGGGDSLVTPSPAGQTDLLRTAYEGAGIPLDELRYVEAHGTGTGRGDPVEAAGIGLVLGQPRRPESGPLVIGSVKTNIGHLEPVAGLAALVKVLLSVEHGVVPASLHSEELNPAIPFDELNLRVAREPLVLPVGEPAYLGVNSFGWGGTNAHVIVAPAPARVPAQRVAAEVAPVVVPVSAHSSAALRRRVADLAAATSVDTSVADLAGTLAWQRDGFAHRAAFVASSPDELVEALTAYAEDPDGAVTGTARAVGRTAFVFPGQGSQWAAMGRQLLASDAVFAATLRRCAAALAPHVSWDLVDVVAGRTDEAELERLDVLQPTLWAVTVSLAEVWRAAGIEPDVVVGHSQGEVSAATVSGALSYEDAALVVARRSAIAVRACGRGLMLAVDLDVAGAHAALEGFEEVVSLAVNNGPTSCVLSGDTDAILLLKEMLEADGTYCRLVNVDYASHSPQMDELTGDLLEALAPLHPRDSAIEMVSTVLAHPIAGSQLGPDYWVANLRRPVLFADVMTQLFAAGVTHVVEISPHPVLGPALEQLASACDEPPRVLSTLRRDAGSPLDLQLALAAAYVSGLHPLDRLPRHALVPLPSYPWQRSTFWPATGARRSAGDPWRPELTPSATEPDTWETGAELSTADTRWLTDHTVHDAVVFPGAGMLALAVAAAVSRSGAAPAALERVRLLRDLTLGDDPVPVRTVLRDDVAGGGSISLHSLPPHSDAWLTHATTRVRYGGAVRPARTPEFPRELLDATSVQPDAFYDSWAARGLGYGPAFQGVRGLHVGDGAALGLIRLPERCRTSALPYGLHPALWDAALQVSLALVPGDAVVVPVEVARIEVLQDLAEPVHELWSHAVTTADGVVDLCLYGMDERPLLVMEGLVLTPLALSDVPEDVDTVRLHRVVFVPSADAPAPVAGGDWLVCGADDERVGMLADALRDGGAEVRTASTDGPLVLEPGSEPAGIVFLAPTAGLPVQRAQLMALATVVAAASQTTTPPRLVVLTTGAADATPGDRPDPGAALFTGFTRVLRREHGELSPALLDVGATVGWAHLAAAELARGDDEDEVALRGDTRLVGRLHQGACDTGLRAPVAWAGPRQPFRLVPERPGSCDGVAFHPLTRRAPGPGEVEVEVEAAALNFIDVMKAMGTYPDPEGGGELLGGELAGTVVAVGPDVVDVACGDRVVGCVFGAVASHVTLRADHTRPVPAGMSAECAAALPLVMTTAWYALHDLARVRPGETVLVHSAAGGLGLAALQVARALGATVLATAGTEDKRDHLRQLGVEHVFDSRDLSWADDVRRVTGGRGVDVVLNSLTGAAVPLGLEVLAEDGRFLEVGKKDVYGGRSIALTPFRKSISLTAVDLAGLMSRRPERFAEVLADLWAQVSSGRLTPLPRRTWPMSQAAEALRDMSHGTHIGKLVLVDPASVTSVAPEALPGGRLRPDATYLVTGGLGALGLSLAADLADRGARSLALLGRSAPHEAAQATIARLRTAGVQVQVLAADVADRASLSTALDQLRTQGPPLRGVVHAAGILDDATVATMTREQLDRVLAPKVDGARLLHELTLDDALDLFVLFSSAAAMVGNAGQAAYAAGNAYLDALAGRRRADGLPALSVQWGPFADIGLAASDANRGVRLSERGMGSFPVEQAWPALARLLSGDEAVVAYVPLDLRQWFDAYPETAAQKSWQDLRAASTADGPVAGGAFPTALAAASAADRGPLVEGKVRELAGRVLRIDPGAIDPLTPFTSLGLDSLMSLELRNRLESVFGLKLSPTLLWTYGSSSALAGVLCDRLATPPDTPSTTQKVEVAA